MTSTAEPLAPLPLEDALARLAGSLPWQAERGALAALATALDRLPLALDLAARRAHVYSLKELVALARRAPLDLARPLSPGEPGLAEAVEAALRGLPGDVRARLAALSALPGSFDRELAGAVTERSVDALVHAAERGLVQVEHSASGAWPPRFRMLRCARAHLASEAPADASRRAAAALETRASALTRALWLRRDEGVQRELELLREALEISVAEAGGRLSAVAALALELGDGGRTPAARRLARLDALDLAVLEPWERGLAWLALADARRVAGDVDGARVALDGLHEVIAAEESTELTAAGQAAAGQLAIDRGQSAQARMLLTRALAEGEHLAPAPRALLETTLGSALFYLGKPGEAIEAHERALEAAERAGHLGLCGVARGNLGVALVQSAPAEAQAHLQQAQRALRTIGDLGRLAVAAVNLGQLALGRGDDESAETWLLDALDAYARTGNTRGAAIVRSNLGELAHARGALSAARSHFEEGLRLAEEAESAVVGAVLASQLGRLLLEEGRWSAAHARLEAALRVLEAEGEVLYSALAAAAMAICVGLMGDRAGAEARMEEALAKVHSTGAQELLPAMFALQAALAAALAAGAEARGDEALARSERARAGELLEQSRAGEGGDTLIARRIAEQLLALPAPSHALGSEGQWLLVAPDCHWFRRGADHVELSRRPTLARVLAALVDAHPRPLSAPLIFARAWPEQQVLKQAQHERVRAAISALRKQGLRGLIERHEGGYRLAPSVQIDRWPPRQR